MSLWTQFKTNVKSETNGVEISNVCEPNDDGTSPTFYLARIGGQNHQFAKVRESVMRPYLREIEAGTLQPEIHTRLNIEVFCKANLRGWKNIYDQDNQAIPFSYDKAYALLNELPDLYLTLAGEASKMSNYQDVVKETAEKNS